jgi:hypothetical protein
MKRFDYYGVTYTSTYNRRTADRLCTAARQTKTFYFFENENSFVCTLQSLETNHGDDSYQTEVGSTTCTPPLPVLTIN